MKPSSIRSRGYQYKDPAIYRKLMVDTLEYWRDCRPAFYSLLSILPPTSFRIIADDDYRDVRDEWTIPDFMENRKLFHPRHTCFTIWFKTYIYRSEWYECDPNWNKRPEYFCGVERTVIRTFPELVELPEYFEPILACQLRESMLEGKEFDLEPVYRALRFEARAKFETMARNCTLRLRYEFQDLVRTLQPFL